MKNLDFAGYPSNHFSGRTSQETDLMGNCIHKYTTSNNSTYMIYMKEFVSVELNETFKGLLFPISERHFFFENMYV